MHVIIIHATHMSSMNSKYHHITLQSTSLLTTHRAYKDHITMIHHYIKQRKQIRSEYNSLTNGLEKPCKHTCPSTRDQTHVCNYTSNFNVELHEGDSIGVRVLI